MVPISWLKTAYLSVFAILGPCARFYTAGAGAYLVRKQILNPEETLIERLTVRTEPEFPIGVHLFGGQNPFWAVKTPKTPTILLPTSVGASFYRSSLFSGDRVIQPHRVGFPFCRFGLYPVASVMRAEVPFDIVGRRVVAKRADDGKEFPVVFVDNFFGLSYLDTRATTILPYCFWNSKRKQTSFNGVAPFPWTVNSLAFKQLVDCSFRSLVVTGSRDQNDDGVGCTSLRCIQR